MEFWYSLFSFFLFFLFRSDYSCILLCLSNNQNLFTFTFGYYVYLGVHPMLICFFSKNLLSFDETKCLFFFFAFAFNAKSFAIGILTFCSFFLSSKFFWTDCQKLFSQHFNFSCQENVWSRFELFLGYTKLYFRKNCSWSCYSRGVWHITRLICTVTSTCNVQKSTRNCQNWPSKHQRKNIIQTASRWQKI